MVSKSKILGKPALIFVTIGSTSFQFDRLLSTVDKILFNLKSNSMLIIQGGNSKYKWNYKNIKKYNYLSPPDMINIIKKSDKIITHGGFGTIYLISHHCNNMPFIVARLYRFREHVDDHQKYFLEFIKRKFSKSYQKFFFTEGNLEKQITNFILNNSQINILKKYLFNRKNKFKLINKLRNLLDIYENTFDS